MNLREDHFFNANDPEYLRKNPKARTMLSQWTRQNMPRECIECIFFKWITGDDGSIISGRCAAKPEIGIGEFEYGKVADGCPLRE